MPNKNKGYFYMLLAVISFAVMSSLVKTIPEVNSTTTTFIRFAVGVGLLGILAITKKINLSFVNSPLLIARGLTGGIAVFLLYLSIVKLGVGKATVFVYSYPIFASIFGTIFLKEKVRPIQWMFILLAFTGIYLLSVKEGIDFSTITIYEGFALLGSIMSAISVNLVKKLHDTDQSSSIFFAQSLIGFWLFIIPTNLNGSIGSFSISLTLIAIGIVAAAGQLVMTEAYRYVSVSKGSSMHMMVPLLNIFVGIVFFNEAYTIKEFIGATFVITACLGVITSNNLKFRFFGPR